MIKKATRVLAICLPLLLAASCGGSGAPEGVQNSTINFDPPSLGTVTLDIETITSEDAFQVFRIEVRSPTGYPQIGVDVLLSSGFTVYAGHPSVSCTGSGGTCTVAPGVTPLNLSEPVKTGPNGTFEATVVFTMSPFVTGDIKLIEAFSGTGYRSATVSVECGDSQDPGLFECL